jgi:hypothetical protein
MAEIHKNIATVYGYKKNSKRSTTSWLLAFPFEIILVPQQVQLCADTHLNIVSIISTLR